MESVRVPQHLELQDVVAWGLGALDLLCVVGGFAVAWWLYLALPGPAAARVVSAAPFALVGLACGVVRIGELPLRDWLIIAFAYALRPRVLVTD